jgi:WD40 repeat protein
VTLDAGTGEVLFTGQREGCQGLVASLLCKGDLVYAGYTDGCVRVWRNGEWKGSYRGHQGTVLSLALVGKEMFTGSKDQTIMTWNLKEAKPHVIWRGKSPQNGAIRGLDVHRGTVWFGDGTRVLAQNIATGMRVFKCEGHEGIVKRIVLHGPTDTLFSIADDKHVFVWDTNTGQQVATCRGHTDTVNAIVVDDRGFLYSAGADNTVREWVTPSLLARAADGPPAAAGAAVSSPPTAARSRTASRADPLDDPPKPMKAAPKRTGSVAAFNAPTTQSRDSSNGGTPTRAAPKRTSAAPAKKSTDLEALEALDDEHVPLDKLDDDVKPSDWDDIDNLLDFGDL